MIPIKIKIKFENKKQKIIDRNNNFKILMKYLTFIQNDNKLENKN